MLSPQSQSPLPRPHVIHYLLCQSVITSFYPSRRNIIIDRPTPNVKLPLRPALSQLRERLQSGGVIAFLGLVHSTGSVWVGTEIDFMQARLLQERRPPVRESVITINIIAYEFFLFSHGEGQTSKIDHASCSSVITDHRFGRLHFCFRDVVQSCVSKPCI